MMKLYNPLHETSYPNACEKYIRNTCNGNEVNPYGTSNQTISWRFFFLSNFYECPVTYKQLTYTNNEAAFQAQKCTSDSEKIQFTKLNPTEAKKLGRKVICGRIGKLSKSESWKKSSEQSSRKTQNLQTNCLPQVMRIWKKATHGAIGFGEQ